MTTTEETAPSAERSAPAAPGGIERVGIVGAGQLGSGLAEVCARAHLDVVLWERNREAALLGRRRIQASLDRGVSSGKITGREREQAVARIAVTTALDPLADRDLVVEAVVEDRETKSELLRRLDVVVNDPDAILATTTSSLSVSELGACTTRPERVLGMHFFHPVPVLPLVELVCTPATSADTRSRAEDFATRGLGKQVVCTGDRPGFVVNALLVPYLLSAIRMVEQGLAAPAQVDEAMVLGCAHPMGPLALADLVGLDNVQAIAESMAAESGQELHRPPELLRRMVAEHRTGVKAGRGFHRYDADGRLLRER